MLCIAWRSCKNCSEFTLTCTPEFPLLHDTCCTASACRICSALYNPNRIMMIEVFNGFECFLGLTCLVKQGLAQLVAVSVTGALSGACSNVSGPSRGIVQQRSCFIVPHLLPRQQQLVNCGAACGRTWIRTTEDVDCPMRLIRGSDAINERA